MFHRLHVNEVFNRAFAQYFPNSFKNLLVIQKIIKHEESESKILYKRFWDGPHKFEECRQACSTLSRHKSKSSHPNKIK